MAMGWQAAPVSVSQSCWRKCAGSESEANLKYGEHLLISLLYNFGFTVYFVGLDF